VENFREFDLIRWIQSQVPADDPLVRVGIGDDAAVVANRDAATLVTTDMLVEGVHFSLAEATPRQVGWKAMACSVSDVAAMGGRASAAVVSCALPRGFGQDNARGLVLGLLECAREFGVRLVGGDVTATGGPLVLNVAMLGDTEGRPPVLRSGARADDALLVTGALGGSRLGSHLRFTPRQAEALALAEGYALHAMIDVSDGLAIDLHHILEESGVGARVEAKRIPISPDAHRAAEQSGRSPLGHALADGEDYELLFTLDDAEAARLLAAPPFETQVTRIGTITASGAILVHPGGGEQPLERRGWEHSL